ncbi:hypothetical protein Acr_28g0003730 [Actinidia rufa]|uniref:Uncharacterized protein n=1 Tax=Actinidia rufa TaxID=165716 RepID=A0A7J0H9I0_9ERIC|nr:hypothetical protein Acr_28g0003730 [Actinidia rufa]
MPSWISDHLGEKSFMANEVTQLSSSTMGSLGKIPLVQRVVPQLSPPPYERKTNIMTQDEMDHLRESHSFPPSIQIRLPKKDETIASTRPGEVAFYETAFHAGLCLPLHPIIRRILYFYNICPAQLIFNAWSLFALNKILKSDSGWLYFKARSKKTLLGGYPGNVKGWKKKFFFILGDDWEFPSRTSRDVNVPKIPKTLGTPGKRCNKPPVLSMTEQGRLDGILD